MQMKDSRDFVSITNGIFIKHGKYENLIQDMMQKFKANSFIQAELFRDCAFETATGIFDHIATGNDKQAIDWAGLVIHHPSEEIWKVGPLAVILKTWWNDFAGKMSLEDFLKCPPIVIEILQSVNDHNKQLEMSETDEVKKKLAEIEKALGVDKKKK